MGGGAEGCCLEKRRPAPLNLQQVGQVSPEHSAWFDLECLGSSAWVSSLSPRARWRQLGIRSSGKEAAAWVGTAGEAAAGQASHQGWMISKPSLRAPLAERSSESRPDHSKIVKKLSLSL